MNFLTVLLNCIIHIILILLFEGIFLFVILFPILKNAADKFYKKYNDEIFSVIIQKGFGNVIETGNKITFKPPLDTIIYSNVIDEQKYLQIQDQMPYIIYAILLFVLFVSIVIIILISNSLNIKIDYLAIFICSVVSFILICAYAFLVLWYTLTQPYSLVIMKDIYSSILEVFNSL